MKAEHRKELQTNSLADFLGRTVRTVRGGGTGFSWFKVMVVVLLVCGVAMFFVMRNNRARTNAELWEKLDENTQGKLEDLAKEYKDTKQGQAARFTLAYGKLWDGIRFLGASDPQFMQHAGGLIDEAMQMLDALAQECKDDPERLAEAKYHMAVAKESAAVFKISFLDDAKKEWEDLATGTLAKTAYGQLAAKRHEQLNNPTSYAAISTFYKEFKVQLQKARVQ
jgi:hypothetical protein